MRISNRQLEGGSSGMHPERRERLESMRCTELPPNHLSLKIYGKPEPSKELMDSMAKVGLLQPLVVNQFDDGSHELIVGNTRAEAWRRLLAEKRVKTIWISCKIVHLSELEAEQLVIESNRQRVKTEDEKNREAAELLRIETALAKERMREGGGSGPSGRKNSAVPSKAIERVAEALNESADTTRKRVAIAEAGVQQGTASVNATYDGLPKPSDCPHCSEHFESRGALKKHIRKVHPEKNVRPEAEVVQTVEQPAQQENAGSTPSLPLQPSGPCVTATYCVIRRKSDGAFYRNLGLYAEFISERDINRVTPFPFPWDEEDGNKDLRLKDAVEQAHRVPRRVSRKKQAFNFADYEWVRVDATYSLTPQAKQESDPTPPDLPDLPDFLDAAATPETPSPTSLAELAAVGDK